MQGQVGEYTMTPLDGGPSVREPILQCVHCGYIWTPEPGSGRKRGFCTRCNGFTCGRKDCRKNACLPLEQWLENVEAGRPEDYKPIVGRVEAEPPRSADGVLLG